MNDTLDIQCSLLGGYISNPDIFEPVQHLMRPQLFTHPITLNSYEIIKDYHGRNIKPTTQSILNQLNKIGLKEGAAVIVSKFDEYAYLAPEIVKEYTEELFYKYTEKYLSNEFTAVIGSFKHGNPLEVMLRAKNAITNVELAYNNVSKDRNILDVFDEAFRDIVDMKNGTKPVVKFSFGVKELDEKTGGVNDGPNIVAATPGSGKTSLIVGMIVKNCIYDNKPFLFFSLEMKAKDIMKNIIANITEINSRSIREGNVDDEQIIRIKDVRTKLKSLLEIDETDGITWQQVEAKIRSYRKRHKIPITEEILVAIDFIQKMRNTPDEMRLPQEERMGITMNELARASKNENVCLVEVSQFSRENSKRDTPRPRLTDLKGSSAIEQNAVLALLMFRPEMHGITTTKSGESSKGLCEINIAKGRFVHPEPIYVRFEGKYSRFLDYTHETGINTSATESF